MARYLITFDAMPDLSDEDLPVVAKAAGDVTDEAIAAGVWVFGGGLLPQMASTVAPDGVVTDGPFPETKEFIGGLSVVEVDTREEALEWAAKLATACRCKQEVRQFMVVPEH
jgi:hypothetical protein